MENDFVRVDGIDVEIQIVFRTKHLNLLTPFFELAKVPQDEINKMIDEYTAAGETVSFERWVLEYGQSKLNPLMNTNLGRATEHPTFNNLLKAALKDQIEHDPTILQLRRFSKKV